MTISFSQPKYVFHKITTQAELPFNRLIPILQDTAGFMWFLSDHGLSRYDGLEFKTFSHKPHDSNSILGTINTYSKRLNSNKIWIGYKNGGAGYLNLYNEKIKNYAHKINDEHSLSNDSINAIKTTKHNEVWIGTNYGLNKYITAKDHFKRYLPDKNNPKAIAGAIVRKIIEDRKGNIWICTSNGLSLYDRNNDNFINFQYDPDDPNTISNNDVSALLLDRNNNYWFGFSNSDYFSVLKNVSNKSLYITPNSLKFINTKFKDIELTDNHKVTVYKIKEFNNQQGVWMATNIGLNNIKLGDKDDFEIGRYFYEKKYRNPKDITDIKHLFPDSEQNLWIGNGANYFGLFNFNINSNSFVKIPLNQNDPHGIADNKIKKIFEDYSQVVWFSTSEEGLAKVDLNQKQFKNFRHLPNNPNSLSNPDCYSVYEDNKHVYIGTGKGLNIYHKNTGKYKHLSKENDSRIPGNHISIITPDPKGYLWIGFFDNSFSKYYPQTQRLENPSFDLKNKALSQKKWNIHTIYPDSNTDSIVWMGGNGTGLLKVNKVTKTVYSYSFSIDKHITKSTTANNKFNIHSNKIQAILELKDHPEILLIGTALKGLVFFNKKNENFFFCTPTPVKDAALSTGQIEYLYQDNKGIIWIGTCGGGLYQLIIDSDFDYSIRSYKKNNPDDIKFVKYTTKDGLAGNSIFSINEDDQGCIWTGTNNGLARFNPETGDFINYHQHDGTQGNYYNAGASTYKNKDGFLYFAGKHGVTFFHPDSIKPNTIKPKSAITKLRINNKLVNPGDVINDQVIIKNALHHTDKINLNYKNKNFSLEFAAFHFVAPEKNKFKYKLEGYDKNWTTVSASHRWVTYTNLNPGKYTFRLFAANYDNIWQNKPTTLTINILPRWYQGWWFYFIIILIAGAGFYLFIDARRRQNKKAREYLTKELEKGKNELQEKQTYLQHKIQIIEEKKKAEEENNWYNEGLKQIGTVLSKNKNNLNALAYEIIKQITNYIGAEKSAFILLHEADEENENALLKVIATYPDKFEERGSRSFLINESEVGACFQSGEMIKIDHLPENYIINRNNQQEKQPDYLYLLPLKQEEHKVGVLEIASTKQFKEITLNFLEEISATIASSIIISKNNKKLQNMIKEADEQANKLKQQEEELRQNMEELTVTQEESDKREEKIRKERDKLKKEYDANKEEIEKLKKKIGL
jgi:ligand-binding sensor domain-containing protein